MRLAYLGPTKTSVLAVEDAKHEGEAAWDVFQKLEILLLLWLWKSDGTDGRDIITSHRIRP